MKAVRIHQPGGPEGLVYEEAPEPYAGVGDVLVRVHAASFTPGELDWPVTWVDRGGRDRTPVVPAHEVSGVVTAVGYGTTGLRVGDRVYGLTDRHRDGAAAEYLSAEARDLAVLPDTVTHVAAAALAMPGLTAWQALFSHGQLAAGRSVVVHGAGGGVGSVAVQLARDTGAHVIGTDRSSQREVAIEAGVHEFVDLDRHWFDGRADLVFDTVGGDVLARSAAVVRPGGTLVSISAPPPAVSGGRAVYFIVEPDRAQLTELADRVRTGRLRPMVEATYALPDARQAFLAKHNGVPGKIVLKAVDDD
ncbi:NADP-dependent oxidoreductase [Streptomyces spirodelae]|uniref:NADP-dependent oxidoreductase n=1 Tax=Streptomyces spirodelae TaxID=2812904 RepID=A0ABS3WTA4_9ACTN|nr:NADP-dependent oxidoreductase [Streptomyces spirodelae]MBO8186349.1 NADP-dependent oxidoreductase [Streptomyces spirodelae]